MKQKNKGIKWVLGIAVIAVIAILASSKIRTPRQLVGDEVEVKAGDISTYYSFSGSVEAKNRQTIFSDQAMGIKEFKVKKGDIVKKDDVLYRTSNGINIKSEIDGEVLDIFVEEDEQLMPGTKVVEIVDYKDLQLKVKVDEYDLNAIKKDAKANITIHALNKDFEGTVTDVAKEGVYMNGVTFFDTTISIKNEGDIRVGMSAEAKVLNESVNNAAILPMTAIRFRDDNSSYVSMKKDETIEDVDIQLGITDGVNVEVKSGINIGDKVFIAKKVTNDFGPSGGVRAMSSGGDN